jgi:hypothetical protein
MQVLDDDEEEVQIIESASTTKDTQENNNSTPTKTSQTVSKPSSQSNTPRLSHAIRLRNPYRKKHKTRKPAFDKQLREISYMHDLLQRMMEEHGPAVHHTPHKAHKSQTTEPPN